MTINLNQIGTVTHGTLRDEDLAPAFYQYGISIGANVAQYQDAVDAIAAGTYGDPPENVDEVIAGLMDTINAELPDYLYFGSIEGDGSDFGTFAVDGIDEELLGALIAADAARDDEDADTVDEIEALRDALEIALAQLRDALGLLN